MSRTRRGLVLLMMCAVPLVSFSEDKKAPSRKKPAAKQQAKKSQDQDWGRFSSTSKRELDAADKKKAEKAAKK